MTFDVYGPCPCGSGKKLKFCCQDIAAEMDKVLKLKDSDQPRLALQLLEKLGKSHPLNAWVATTRATIHLNEGQNSEAKDVLQHVVQSHPEHDVALGLYALAALASDGYESAKPAVQRAFQRCAARLPELVSGLALGVATYMQATRRHMAARQHLALAMRFSAEDARQDIFVRLLQFDGNREIPYPVRSVYHLAEYAGSEEAAKATALCRVGCWGPAARLLGRLAEQEPNSPVLWQNLGLCRAWDGDEPGAADALHRAARLQSDFDAAVECETLAQILDLGHALDVVRSVSREYRVKSASRFLALLDGQELIVRLKVSSEELQEIVGDDEQPAGLFELVDRPPRDGLHDVSPETIPRVLGQLLVLDANTETGDDARAILTQFETDEANAARRHFESIADAEIEPVDTNDEAWEQSEGQVPREYFPLEQQWHFPPKLPQGARRRFQRQQQEQFLAETWPSSALASLGGRTPLEAAGDPELRIQLTAALYVLDALFSGNERTMDFGAMCERLKLEAPRSLEIAENMPLNSLSVLKLMRVPVAALNDAQLGTVLNRALLIHHPGFLYKVLVEVLSRPACLDKVNLGRTYGTLAALAVEQGRRDEALDWVAKGKAFAETVERENQFEARLEWTMREFSLRLEDPEDPELRPLLKHVWEYYVPKLPALGSHLIGLLDTVGLTPPAETSVAAEVGYGSTTDSGLWTPESTSSGPQAGKKLWLPGQE